MKRLIIILIIGLLISCNNSNSKKNTINKSKKTTTDITETGTKEKTILEKKVLTETEIKERTKNAFQDFIYLYSELDEFKSNPSFKANGFSQHFQKWLKNIETFRKDRNSEFLISKGIIIADLQNLGLAYAGSKGSETEITKTLNKSFINLIPTSSRPIYGKKNYKKLKTNNKSIDGKWIIKIAMFNNNGYTFEIYQKGNKYVGILPQTPFREIILVKNGSSFSVVGDKYGDYKIITREEFDLKG